MPRRLGFLLCVVCLAGCVTEARKVGPTGVASLSWVEGCWETEDGSSTEYWTRGHDSLIFGFNTLTDGEALVFYEQMRFQRVEGTWQFAAYPRGRGPTLFDAVELSEAQIVVENAENDFPQRIRYQRDGDLLRAAISKLDGSNTTEWAFQACSD